MIDSGPLLFLNGELHYRHLDEISLNLSVARTITDVGWQEYLEGTLACSVKLSGVSPKVSVAAFLGAYPSATQRRVSKEFLARKDVRPMAALATLTDNDLLRGALTAFGWLMPGMAVRAFRTTDIAGACAWLGTVARFDGERAIAAWTDAQKGFGLLRGAAR